MSMKYKLLLCVVVLLVCAAAVYAAPVEIYSQDFSDPKTYSADPAVDADTPWTFEGNWAVIDQGAGAAALKPHMPALGATPNKVLVYNPVGDYEPSANARVTTFAIDCSGYTSVQLSFDRSLTVEDAEYDQATIQVSNNGSDWTDVYMNPTDPEAAVDKHNLDLTDPTWHNVTYDISSVADDESAVQIRWGILANSTNDHAGNLGTPIANLAGWGIDNIVLTGAGPDAFYSAPVTGTALPAGFNAAVGGIWQVGAPSAGGGQLVTDFTTIPPTTVTVGRDPGVLPAGATSTSVIGTIVGSPWNYPAGMNAGGAGLLAAPQYLVWGPLDLTGLQGTKLEFQEWLNVGSGNLDKAWIQAHVSDPDADNPDDPEVAAENTTSATVNQAAPKKVYALDTTDHYAQGDWPTNNKLTVTIKFDTDNLAAGNTERALFQYTLDATASTPTWLAFTTGGVPIDTGTATVTDGAVTTNTNDSDSDTGGVDTVVFGATNFKTAADYINAQNNAKFGVRVWLTKADGTDLATTSTATIIVKSVTVKGVLWEAIFKNPTGSETLADIGDGKAKWKLASYALPDGADGNENVWVRWSFGPTDSGFSTEYGGWNITDPAIVEASRQWAAEEMTVPSGLVWGKKAGVTVPAKNTGTATWDDSYSLYEVQGVETTIPNAGEPGAANDLDVIALALAPDPLNEPITRWNVGSVDVGDTVAPDETESFAPNVTAPPLTSVVYKTPIGSTAPADPDLSVLACDWALASPTPDGDISWLPTYRNGSIANSGIATDRFPDILPGTDGAWARYWVDELAGRVPMVIQGYPDGTYGPKIVITRDQIAVFIARAKNLNQDPAAYPTPHFSDVPTDFWAYGAIEACATFQNPLGTFKPIVNGFPDKTYHPTDPITRDAMTKYIVNGAEWTSIQAIGTPPVNMWYPIYKAPTATSKDEQDAAVKAGWFVDVPLWNDPDNPLDTASAAYSAYVFRDYIGCLVNKQIGVVTGYPPVKQPDDTYLTYYLPAVQVSRDQLAVFVWRAFMRGRADGANVPSVVVLGGPAITAVPVVTGEYPYYGYTNTGKAFVTGPFLGTKDKYTTALVQSSALSHAYVTLDAIRLAGVGGPTTVTFELRRVTGTTGAAVSSGPIVVSAATVSGWVTALTGAGATGEPYHNVAWAIPTGLQGDFNLVCTINTNEMKSPGQQPAYSVMRNMFSEDFDSVSRLSYWTYTGQPSAPGPKIYPLSYTSTQVTDQTRKDNFKVLFYAPAYNSGGSLELQGTQAATRLFTTANRHNIRIGIRVAGAGTFGSADQLRVEWSPDYGSKGTAAAWKSVTTLSGSSVPKSMKSDNATFFDLPNGDPNQDPKIIGADDNANFGLRLSINTTNSALRAYFDTITIDGT